MALMSKCQLYMSHGKLVAFLVGKLRSSLGVVASSLMNVQKTKQGGVVQMLAGSSAFSVICSSHAQALFLNTSLLLRVLMGVLGVPGRINGLLKDSSGPGEIAGVLRDFLLQNALKCFEMIQNA